VSYGPKCVIRPHGIFERSFPFLLQLKMLKSKINFTKLFMQGLTIHFGCCHGRPDDKDVKTPSRVIQRTHKWQAACAVSAAILTLPTGYRTQTRNAQTQFNVSLYEYQGIGKFARECLTTLKRQENTSDQRGKGSARRGLNVFAHLRQTTSCRKAEVRNNVTCQVNKMCEWSQLHPP
jgi:hypothetical protein